MLKSARISINCILHVASTTAKQRVSIYTYNLDKVGIGFVVKRGSVTAEGPPPPRFRLACGVLGMGSGLGFIVNFGRLETP